MGASESVPEKAADAGKVVLRVRLHSLGHGWMEERFIDVTCPADMRAGVILLKMRAQFLCLEEPQGLTALRLLGSSGGGDVIVDTLACCCCSNGESGCVGILLRSGMTC